MVEIWIMYLGVMVRCVTFDRRAVPELKHGGLGAKRARPDDVGEKR